jgi:hypothetical protein
MFAAAGTGRPTVRGPRNGRQPSCLRRVPTQPRPWLVALLAGCLDERMATQPEPPRVVSASCEITAGAGRIFELIADPAQQPRWDGNDNLGTAPAGQRVRRAGDVFTMTLTGGSVRENRPDLLKAASAGALPTPGLPAATRVTGTAPTGVSFTDMLDAPDRNLAIVQP